MGKFNCASSPNHLHCGQEMLRVLGSAPGQGYPFDPPEPKHSSNPRTTPGLKTLKVKDPLIPKQQGYLTPNLKQE